MSKEILFAAFEVMGGMTWGVALVPFVTGYTARGIYGIVWGAVSIYLGFLFFHI